jgi:heme exporter protein A
MTNALTLSANGIGKVFAGRTIISGISFSLQSMHSLGLTGRNGSGKSTLLKILAGVLSPTSGDVTLEESGREVPQGERFRHIGFVAPYLQLYDEFTAMENLEFTASIRGAGKSRGELENLLELVNLLPRKSDLVRTYSSGMKQRLKYAFALVHKPPILFLDEPTSNLDRDGIAIVREIVREQKKRGILVIATNDQEDLQFCDALVSVEPAAGGSAKEG